MKANRFILIYDHGDEWNERYTSVRFSNIESLQKFVSEQPDHFIPKIMLIAEIANEYEYKPIEIVKSYKLEEIK